jgi:hypothetical protein
MCLNRNSVLLFKLGHYPAFGQFDTSKRGQRGSIYIFDSMADRYFGEGQPKVPIAAPTASMPAAVLPLEVPSRPARRFFSLCCFSINVAPAGKIAGNARKSPATPGPYRLAINPVRAVTMPPKTKRKAKSSQRKCWIEETSSPILIAPSYRTQTNQSPKAAASHTSMSADVATEAGGL